MSDNIKFEFRSKFKKLLNDSNEAIIIAGFEAFMRISAVEARSYLWRMTYSKVEAETVMIQLGIKPCLIQEDKISLLRNELRSEFEKKKPDFLKVDVPPLASEAYENLIKQAKNDTILANIVFNQCYRIVFSEANIRNRVLFLLNSDNDKLYFGGLRQMGFNYYEAEYLKQYHFLIRALLDKLCEQEKKGEFDPEFFNAVEEEWDETEDSELGQRDEYENEEIESSNPNGIVTKRIYKNDEVISEEDVPVEAETESTDVSELDVETASTDDETDGEDEQPELGYKCLDPVLILENIEEFEVFVNKSEDLNTLVKIGNLGYDLNEVVAKKEQIANLLKTSEDFVNAQEAFKMAEEAYNKAIIEMVRVKK